MTVFVDDAQIPATVGHITSTWSHLMADTHDELVTFATALGLRSDWIQRKGRPSEHFDLTASMRTRALAAGAVSITYPGDMTGLIEARSNKTNFDLTAHRRREGLPA